MKRLLAVIVLLAVAGGVAYWWFHRKTEPDNVLVLYGNLDLRQVLLAFNNSERIDAVLVQEGDRVQEGQVVARLDTRRLAPQVAQAEAQAAAQRQVVVRLHNGSRPEEISQAEANVQAAKADADNARRQYERDQDLAKRSKGEAVSQQDLDNAKAALAVAEAKLAVNQKALDLAVAGPRKEEVAEAEARLKANEAQLAYLKQQLDDAELIAPTKAIIRTRLLEAGEMSSPQRPVYSLAPIEQKWVRAYVSEPDLGKVRDKMPAKVVVDSFPNRTFDGYVGFISPVAEFTPKTVETKELRTALVYEVRIWVTDPQDELRLGMPATVRLQLDAEAKKEGETRRQGEGEK